MCIMIQLMLTTTASNVSDTWKRLIITTTTAFLSLNYLVQDNRQIVPIIPTAEYISTPTLVVVPQFRHGVSQLRAPPMA